MWYGPMDSLPTHSVQLQVGDAEAPLCVAGSFSIHPKLVQSCQSLGRTEAPSFLIGLDLYWLRLCHSWTEESSRIWVFDIQAKPAPQSNGAMTVEVVHEATDGCRIRLGFLIWNGSRKTLFAWGCGETRSFKGDENTVIPRSLLMRLGVSSRFKRSQTEIKEAIHCSISAGRSSRAEGDFAVKSCSFLFFLRMSVCGAFYRQRISLYRNVCGLPSLKRMSYTFLGLSFIICRCHPWIGMLHGEERRENPKLKCGPNIDLWEEWKHQICCVYCCSTGYDLATTGPNFSERLGGLDYLAYPVSQSK